MNLKFWARQSAVEVPPVPATVQDTPKMRKVTEPFIEDKNGMTRAFRKATFQPAINNVKKELKSPVLFLIRENRTLDLMEDVQSGEFIVHTPNGKKKSILLSAEKLIDWEYGENHVKAWFAYENSADTYPEDPLFHSELLYNDIEKLANNYRTRDDLLAQKFRMKMWMWIILGIVGIVVLIFTLPGAKEAIFGYMGTAATNATTNVTQQIIANISGHAPIVVTQ